MGLDLEADVVLVVEPDHSGVVGEDADQPVELQGLGRGEDRLLEQVVDRLVPRIRSAPKVLCEQCSLQVWARVSSSQSVGSRSSPAKWCWIVRISARLSEAAPTCSGREGRVVHRAERHRDQPELVMLALAEVVEWQGAKDRLLDGVVGQHALDQAREGVAPGRRPGSCGWSARRPRRSRVAQQLRALSASGSVTPGLGRTWTTVGRPRRA